MPSCSQTNQTVSLNTPAAFENTPNYAHMASFTVCEEDFWANVITSVSTPSDHQPDLLSDKAAITPHQHESDGDQPMVDVYTDGMKNIPPIA